MEELKRLKSLSWRKYQDCLSERHKRTQKFNQDDWMDAEDEQLRLLKDAGKGWKEILIHLNRSQRGVGKRYKAHLSPEVVEAYASLDIIEGLLSSQEMAKVGHLRTVCNLLWLEVAIRMGSKTRETHSEILPVQGLEQVAKTRDKLSVA